MEIVICGAGYAGTTVAAGLRALAGRARVTLVNLHRYHYFTTLLHEPAAGRADFGAVSVDLDRLVGRWARVVKGRVLRIDPTGRRVIVAVAGPGLHAPGAAGAGAAETPEGTTTEELRYDLLVVALGSLPEFYRIPGLEEWALTLRSLNTARLIRTTIERAMAQSKFEPKPEPLRRILIGGGGFTGVELAGEIADWRPVLARRFDLEPDGVEVVVVEAAPTILPGFDPLLVEEATAILARKGVRFITGTPIRDVRESAVALSDGRVVEAGTIIWTGGVRAHPVVKEAGLRTNPQGRAVVDEYLQAADHPDIYVLGDCALVTGDDGRPLPPTAQLAFEHGRLTAQNLRRRLRGEPQRPHRPHVLGTFLSLGRREALGVVGNRWRLRGWAARTVKDLIAYRYVWHIGGPGLVAAKLRQRWRRS